MSFKGQELLEEGWENLKTGAIAKLEYFLRTGKETVNFTNREFMKYYTYDPHLPSIFLPIF
jgi:hypothetical protein